MCDVADLQRQKAQEFAGRSVFMEPLEESLEHKCRRLVESIEDIMAETDAIGMIVDRSCVAGLKVRVQVSSSDFLRLFAGMDTHVRPTSNTTYLERYIDIGGVTFFTLVWETPAERAARILAKLPEDERQRILKSIK